jgi:anti-sigma regulatory factor (Ser/Thr protein kinase)
VRLLIIDDANPFDPMDSDALLLPETLDEAQVGGLGLLMIRNTVSSMAYERRDGCNRFLLTVARRRADGEPL